MKSRGRKILSLLGFLFKSMKAFPRNTPVDFFSLGITSDKRVNVVNISDNVIGMVGFGWSIAPL